MVGDKKKGEYNAKFIVFVLSKVKKREKMGKEKVREVSFAQVWQNRTKKKKVGQAVDEKR